MKKILTMIAAVIAAATCLSMSAMAASTDIQTETQKGVADESNKWTVTEKYFAVSYTMPLAEKYDHTDNGCCGIIFGGSDGYACVYIPFDIANGANVCDKQVKFGPWWSNDNGGRYQAVYDVISDADMGKDGTVLVLGSQENGKLTIDSIYFNGKKIDAFNPVTLENYNGRIGYATKITDVTATVKLRQSGTALDKTCFDAKDPTPGKTENPTTGSASVVIAAVAVVALAGVVVATKKREQD